MIRILTSLALIWIIGVQGKFDQDQDWNCNCAQSFYDFHARDLNGKDVSFDKYRGRVLIVFNGANHCPLSTKNFKKLQALYEQFGPSEGLEVVAFIVDSLVRESGSIEEIQAFVKHLNITFDVYEKIVADGDTAHPVYKWMKSQLTNQDKIHVGTKILIDKNGMVVSRFEGTTPSTNLENALKQYFQ